MTVISFYEIPFFSKKKHEFGIRYLCGELCIFSEQYEVVVPRISGLIYILFKFTDLWPGRNILAQLYAKFVTKSLYYYF